MKKFLLPLLLLPWTLSAQEPEDQIFRLENNPPPHYPFSVSGSYINVGDTNFRTPGFKHDHLKYIQSELALSFTYPCSKYCGLIFGAGWIGTKVDMENNPEFHETQFNYVNASIGAYTKAFPDWTWTVSVSTYLDTQQLSLIDYALYDGVLWGKYDFCKCLELDFGVIVEVGLNKEKVWPILGLIYAPRDYLRFNLIYPIDISIEYDFLDYWTLGTSVRFLRNRHRVKKNEPNPQGIFEYETSGAEVDLGFAPFDGFSITGFVGSTFAGDLKVTNRNNHHALHYKFKGSFYSGCAAILSF